MSYTIDRVDVWRGSIPDAPGELGKVLETLSSAGANLEFVFARPGEPGKAVFFLAPLQGAAQIKAAQNAGMVKWESMPSLRIHGPNKAGLGAQLTKALGEAGINIQGVSAMGMGKSSRTYFALKKEDFAQALKVLKQALT